MRNSQIKNKLSNHKKPFAIKQPLLFSPRAYRNFALGLFSFLCAYVVAGTFAPVQSSDASTVTITNNTTDYYITITSADNLPMSVEASPTGQLAYAADTLNIITNSPSGYKLYVSTSGNDNNIYQNGSSSTFSSGYFQPTTGTITNPVALTQNTWGFALSKVTDTSSSKYNPLASSFANISEYVNYTGAPTVNSTWAGIPTFANSENAKISELNTSNTPNGNDLDIYYGVNASTTLPDGSYTTELTYTAISEGVNQFPTMQDFTAEQCYNMATNTSINLSDSRDDKYYRVTKMADGHCWMTDNLALDGTDAAGNVRVLTPSDSNVEQNRTLAANITDSTTSEYDVVQIYSGVADDVTSSCDLTTNPYCIVNTTTKYGNLYNWNAATAGVGKRATTGTVTESICPKGWQLPDNSGVYSYQNLFLHYGLPTTNTTDGNAVQTVQQAPFYFALDGGYGPAAENQGVIGDYWSRTVTTEYQDNVYRLIINTNNGNFTPQNSIYSQKHYGFSVRCVFSGQPTDPTMQDFTTTQCNNLGTNASTVLVDRRNREFYRVVHAADGNCWMADNLSIYGQTISAADSDLSSGTFTIPASSEWGGSGCTGSNNYCGDVPRVHLVTATSTSSFSGDKSPYYGQIYYNWPAAVALSSGGSTTTAPNTSICPSGWQLPVNGDANTNKSWAKLLDVYGIDTGAKLLANGTLGFTKYYGHWDRYSASEVVQGSHGNFWSGTPSAETTVYGLVYNSGGVYPQNNDTKGYGFSIRCVAR
ncbi:hypothetical protein IKG16_00560 [Candidatus Saccharibacteria bacterium]|nr:hypothetical protein [Candidatus Saccharibacteria bacterium]